MNLYFCDFESCRQIRVTGGGSLQRHYSDCEVRLIVYSHFTENNESLCWTSLSRGLFESYYKREKIEKKNERKSMTGKHGVESSDRIAQSSVWEF